ncbi:hypothetical protein, variant [Salpingoeca rosetta]|uniref:N(6)-L-threonylcarbamoyladenine synthase n=1 Tax=Salpingoeca rosetta (strain ATCC 50818 / BSB-021) TaxID=946362 RepID=F2US98_SALR5|nr:hypothetical protein, variant [Salpingoeca rosetta]EGD81006.1 hypothetical protein, variant [Salpingoeca rosetta]|eukprot:XP_004987876.1 hypothetical protein, variant [Salpingoeca rosetta]
MSSPKPVRKKASQRSRRKKVFISLRFGEAGHAGKLLKRELEQVHGLDVFLCDVKPGGNMEEEIITALAACDLAVIMGTKTYGKKTPSTFSTYEELRFITARQKPFFFIKMCDDFEEEFAQFHLPDSISYFPWIPASSDPESMSLPHDLAPAIADKLNHISTSNGDGKGGKGHSSVITRQLPTTLDADLTQWLQRYNMLSSMGLVLEKHNITGLHKLEQATEAMRNPRTRALAKRRQQQQKRGQQGSEPKPTEGVRQLHEGMLMRERKLKPAEIARFRRACKARTWRKNEMGNEDNTKVDGTEEVRDNEDERQADEKVKVEASDEGEQGMIQQQQQWSDTPPPVREGVADEALFREYLEKVEDELLKAKILIIWNNTCGDQVNLVGNHVGPEGGKAIAEALKVNTTLTTLYLAYAESAVAFAEALTVNTTLQVLGLVLAWVCMTGGLVHPGLTILYPTLNSATSSHARSCSKADVPMLIRLLWFEFSFTEWVPDKLMARIKSALERNRKLASRTQELKALLEHGSVPLSTAKVFVCGHYGIGKTTLINTLQSSPHVINTMVRRRRKTYDEPDRPDQRTPGVEMHNFALKRGGSSGSVSLTPSPAGAAGGTEDSSGHETTLPSCKLRVYDFAGQTEYHVVHELLFADHNAVFVVCVDLSKDMANVEEAVLYWLRFIKTRLHQAVHRSPHPPHVFIVGTKADKPLEHNTLVETTAEAIPHASGVSLPPMQFPSGDALLQSRQLQEWFGDTMRIHPHVIPLNCHELGGACMHHLRDLLHAAWLEVVQQDIQVPKVVELIGEGLALCRKEDEGPWALHRLFSFLLEHVGELARIPGLNEDIFCKALSYLHVRGDVLWFQSIPSLADQIFVSPSWLLSKVVGPALAPDHFPVHLRATEGRVVFSEMQRVFGRVLDPDLVVDVLSSMLLCYEEDAAMHGSDGDGDERVFMLLSRLEWRPERLWGEDGSVEVFAGRRLQIAQHHGMIFPPGVFPRVQSRIVQCLDYTTSLWQTGFFGLLASAECLGRIVSDTCIDLWVRCPAAQKEHAWLALDMIEFPYLVLLASGGHCMLLLAEGVQRFRRLGNLLDDSPGDAFEKVARAMDLTGGGPQVEQLAAQGDEHRFELCHPLRHARSCDFSFSGLRTMAERAVAQHRRDDNSLPLQDARDIAASFQRAALHHIMVQSHRALLYCRSIDKMPTSMVVSGGVACNAYLRDKVAWLCEWHGVQPAFPSPALCTDNGRMIAWTGLEYLRAGVEPEQDISQWRFKTRWPLGVDESASVQAADIPVKRLYAQLASSPQQDTTTASS